MANLSGSATDGANATRQALSIFGDRRENLLKNKRIALFDFHSAHGGRIVPFAGWDMPVHYRDGIKAEHLATRHGASLSMYRTWPSWR